jgi:hypothetical protein
VKATLLSLSATSYEGHPLHHGERAWLESNCYVDLWIEALHAFGYDPHACLPFTVAGDFEGDQWLFFKPPTSELLSLYGVDVQELNIWRPVLDHVLTQVARGRLVLLEVDAFYLPDTAGVSYRSVHTKTTIGIESIDSDAGTLGYFHNAGYYALGREDFGGLFGLEGERREDQLVPYTEFARIERGKGVPRAELTDASLALLRQHIARMPSSNPIVPFRARFLTDVQWLAEQPQATFHVYAFSTLRQCGANFELAASYLRWLEHHQEKRLFHAAEAFETLASQAKTLQFKAARAVVLHKPVDFAPMFDAMEHAWDTARSCLLGWASG